MATLHRRTEVSTTTAARSAVEAYPYDPNLSIEAQRGLDRLRCFADRALAADLFAVFEAAQKNTETEREQSHERERRKERSRIGARVMAERALNGELGPEVKELAEHLLLDEKGERLRRESSLSEFARAFVQLRRLQR